MRSVATRLEQTWKDLASIFDERSTVLALSTLFHQKAEQYKENVPKWNNSCEISNVSTDIATLENSIHQHQTLYETMCQAYTEVHSTSKKLLYQLDHLVQLCKQPTEERRHVSYTLIILLRFATKRIPLHKCCKASDMTLHSILYRINL